VDTKLKELSNKKWLFWGSLYATIVFLFGCYINFTEPYSPGPVTTPTLLELFLWGLLYVPVIVAPFIATWKITEFGFTIYPFLFLGCILVLALCGSIGEMPGVTWGSAFWEAFARTGEEVFFRGFVYFLILRLFSDRKRPWLWAVIGSSIIFTFAHTQAFYLNHQSIISYPSISAPVYIIGEFINLFLTSIVLALLRAWTHSVLPGAIMHGLLQGGILTLPFVLIIYSLFILWAHLRGEKVIFWQWTSSSII
jgi:membrane protease YdiL (CAAX protease family)